MLLPFQNTKTHVEPTATGSCSSARCWKGYCIRLKWEILSENEDNTLSSLVEEDPEEADDENSWLSQKYVLDVEEHSIFRCSSTLASKWLNKNTNNWSGFQDRKSLLFWKSAGFDSAENNLYFSMNYCGFLPFTCWILEARISLSSINVNLHVLFLLNTTCHLYMFSKMPFGFRKIISSFQGLRVILKVVDDSDVTPARTETPLTWSPQQRLTVLLTAWWECNERLWRSVKVREGLGCWKRFGWLCCESVSRAVINTISAEKKRLHVNSQDRFLYEAVKLAFSHWADQ